MNLNIEIDTILQNNKCIPEVKRISGLKELLYTKDFEKQIVFNQHDYSPSKKYEEIMNSKKEIIRNWEDKGNNK